MPPNTTTAATTTSESTSNNNEWKIQNVQVLNLIKTKFDDICTGIGFLDHMLDQLNSHAQIGITITVIDDNNKNENNKDRNRYKNSNQDELLKLIGHAIGTELHKILPQEDQQQKSPSRFCCPLDEALVECILMKSEKNIGSSLVTYQLEPFGIFGNGDGGRTFVGSMKTLALKSFFEAFATSSGLNISLRKVRGNNGHHIIESTFKSLSRALRNYIDHTNNPKTWMSILWGKEEKDDASSLPIQPQQQRTGIVERKTKETSIAVHVQLASGCSNEDTTTTNVVDISTGIPILNEILIEFAKFAHFSKLKIHCNGDLYIDDHHTTEDIGIAFGQVLKQSFGTKAGYNRMWTHQEVVLEDNNSFIEVTMDLSNRPCLTSNLQLELQEYVTTADDVLTTEMMFHFFESLVINAGMTVHIVENKTNNDNMDMLDRIKTCVKAFGTCLYMCCAIDPRRAGQTASSKGTLSV